MDFTLIGVIVSPFIVAYSFRLARKFNIEKHRKIQIALFSILFCTVILFETDVRISSRDGNFIQPSPWVDNSLFNAFLAVHIFIAITTFIGWLTLGIVSQKAFPKSLPGKFSTNHKLFGKWIFFGLIFTAIGGSAIYILAFVL